MSTDRDVVSFRPSTEAARSAVATLVKEMGSKSAAMEYAVTLAAAEVQRRHTLDAAIAELVAEGVVSTPEDTAWAKRLLA